MGGAMYTGVDTAARLTAAQAAKIKAQGFSFVGRYLVPTMYSKALTADEAALLHDAGLAILLCWEMGGEDMRQGASKGAEHGARARKLAESLNIPSGTTIYFAADYDVPQKDLIYCAQYLNAAKAALGKYQIGAYGGERLITFLADRGMPVSLWQCVAWTNQFNDAAAVIQYAWQGAAEAKAMAQKTGIPAVDLDSCEDMRAAGMWMPTAAAEPWYADTMRWAAKEGICDGTRPMDYATRAEVCQMIRNYNRRFEEEDPANDSGILSD